MTRDVPKMTWTEAALKAVLFLLCAPFALAGYVSDWLVVGWHVWRPIEAAWARCERVWVRHGRVVQMGWEDSPLPHRLAHGLGRWHRRRRQFFIRKLGNPDPHLAAYAFKCLLRTGDVRPDDIPEAV